MDGPETGGVKEGIADVEVVAIDGTLGAIGGMVVGGKLGGKLAGGCIMACVGLGNDGDISAGLALLGNGLVGNALLLDVGAGNAVDCGGKVGCNVAGEGCVLGNGAGGRSGRAGGAEVDGSSDGTLGVAFSLGVGTFPVDGVGVDVGGTKVGGSNCGIDELCAGKASGLELADLYVPVADDALGIPVPDTTVPVPAVAGAGRVGGTWTDWLLGLLTVCAGTLLVLSLNDDFAELGNGLDGTDGIET